MSKQKEMTINTPDRGFIFWPVGSGDSTTVVVDADTFMQVDLRHLSLADNGDEDPRMAVIDKLEEILPKVDGKPFLSVFVLTHPDEDHCRGFEDMLSRFIIGELWHTPRVFREFPRDLCEDAQAFRTEAKRRVKKIIENGGNAESGDKVRIIGYDDILSEDNYRGFPSDLLTVPGTALTVLNGTDYSDRFKAFIHAPFKEDSDGDRNETSVAFQITLLHSHASARALFFGDLCYPTIKRIFAQSNSEDVIWNLLLSPHHCSKSVMYWKNEGEKEETLQQLLLDQMEAAADSPGFIIASSQPIPESNEPGDNPPHAIAKHRYEEIVPDKFLCTQEHPNTETPEPIIFRLDEGAFVYQEPQQDGSGQKCQSMSTAVAVARGTSAPPSDQVGFGLK